MDNSAFLPSDNLLFWRGEASKLGVAYMAVHGGVVAGDKLAIKVLGRTANEGRAKELGDVVGPFATIAEAAEQFCCAKWRKQASGAYFV